MSETNTPDGQSNEAEVEIVAVPAQLDHPERASRRTALQTVLSVVLVAGVAAPVVANIISEELVGVLPENWIAWAVGILGGITAVSAALTRIMAIPAVDALLERIGMSTLPGGDR